MIIKMNINMKTMKIIIMKKEMKNMKKIKKIMLQIMIKNIIKRI